MYPIYYSANKSKAPILYDLYGVVNHYGNMGGGHYTAYCQNFLNKKWYEFNDSRVSEISKSDVVSTDSYVLFFRRKDWLYDNLLIKVLILFYWSRYFTMKVGWIGTGVMGLSMCKHLLNANYSLSVYNRTPEKAKPLL